MEGDIIESPIQLGLQHMTSTLELYGEDADPPAANFFAQAKGLLFHMKKLFGEPSIKLMATFKNMASTSLISAQEF